MILECTHLIVQFCKCKVSFGFFFLSLNLEFWVQHNLNMTDRWHLYMNSEFFSVINSVNLNSVNLNIVVEELGSAYAP